MQRLLDKHKSKLKFLWRHIFTIACLVLITKTYFTEPVNWEGAYVNLAIAMLIDWFKVQTQSGSYQPAHLDVMRQSFDDMEEQHRHDDWRRESDPTNMGSLAWYASSHSQNRY